jgi:hypothetical protein
MMHTIVVEIPDYVDPTEAEKRIAKAIKRVSWSSPIGDMRSRLIANDFVDVVEYHHEKMTVGPDEDPDGFSAWDVIEIINSEMVFGRCVGFVRAHDAMHAVKFAGGMQAVKFDGGMVVINHSYRIKPRVDGVEVVEAACWDGTRRHVEWLCRWVNAHPVPSELLGDAEEADDPTLSYVYTTADDVSDVSLWTPDGLESVKSGDWIVWDEKGYHWVHRGDS